MADETWGQGRIAPRFRELGPVGRAEGSPESRAPRTRAPALLTGVHVTSGSTCIPAAASPGARLLDNAAMQPRWRPATARRLRRRAVPACAALAGGRAPETTRSLRYIVVKCLYAPIIAGPSPCSRPSGGRVQNISFPCAAPLWSQELCHCAIIRASVTEPAAAGREECMDECQGALAARTRTLAACPAALACPRGF